MPDDRRLPPHVRPLVALLLLWLGGAALRLTILAVPPVVPLIHLDLHLSQTQVGILSGLPMVLFAGAAIPGSLLIARFGAVRTLIVGLVLGAVGSAARGIGPNTAILYAGTAITAFGVAIMQPSMPPLVREWLPKRVGFGTAVYTNGLLVGEIFPVALTIPLVLPMLDQSWRLDFVFWALPMLVIAGVVLALAPRGAAPTANAAPAVRQWLPDWRNPLIWRLGFTLGSVNAMYFSTNGFLPDYLNHIGRPDLISPSLTALNLGQLPASFMLLMVADRLVRQVWPYLACGLCCFASVLAIMFGGGIGIIAGAAALGFFAAAILVLILAIPPLISAPEDVHRTASGMFTISYSCAVIVPIISGVAWDLTGAPVAAFVPIALCTVALTALAPTVAVKPRPQAG